jgi:hypothetical protein
LASDTQSTTNIMHNKQRSSLFEPIRIHAGFLIRILNTWRKAAVSALFRAPAPVHFDWFTDAEVASYDAVFSSEDHDRVDDATWRDLEGQAFLGRIADGASIYARQYLFHRLRRGATFERGVRPSWMGDDVEAEDVLARTARTRLDLRQQEMEVTAILFHNLRVTVPQWLRHVRWAMTLWMAAPILMLTSLGGLGGLLVFAYLSVWGAVEIRFHARLQLWKRQRRAVLAMLKAIVDLGAVARVRPHPILDGVAAASEDARRLLIALDLDAMERSLMTSDYVNLLTLHQYAVAPARICRFENCLPELRALYATLAECEGRLCLIAHLRIQPQFCWAHQAGVREISLTAMRNPLLDEAQPLTLHLQGAGAFLSGENGVGKSTFLRAIGLNLLAARAFGFCYALNAAVPAAAVWSSMVHEDSIQIGDSLYMAEMRRAQTLLQVAERPGKATFLIDEIFRGTNHVESVACAAAVLNHLAATNVMIVSSHNVVLAPLLSARLAAWRIVRAGEQALRIEPGVLLETNGIDMMRRYGISDSVRAEAVVVHDWFAGHVATPVTFPELVR